MTPASNQVRCGALDHIRALVSGYIDKRRHNHRPMMLQAFIDDSGNDGKSPVFVLAGYLSSVQKWKAFEIDWDKVLKPDDGKQLDVLKMSDVFRNRKRGSRYYGWDDDERDDRLKKFTTVIKRHAMHGIISVVPIEPYTRLIKGRFSTLPLDRPYFLSFFGIMAQLFSLNRHLKLADKVDFVFDTQDSENTVFLTGEYDRFIKCAPEEIRNMSHGYPSFKRDEDVLPLQAADMLAWHARKYYFDLYNGKEPEKEPSNVYLANLLMPEHDIIDIWDEERLTKVADVLNKSAHLKQEYMMHPNPSEVRELTTFFLRRDPTAPGGWRA